MLEKFSHRAFFVISIMVIIWASIAFVIYGPEGSILLYLIFIIKLLCIYLVIIIFKWIWKGEL